MGALIKSKILIVDDSEMNRLILSEMLSDEYEILEAENGYGAISMIEKYGNAISLILLDIVMPEMDGFEVLAAMNKHQWIEEIPVIIISSETTQISMQRAYDLGAVDYISRPFNAYIVKKRVYNVILLYTKQRNLISMVADQMYEKQKGNRLMVLILSHIVEFRNGESGLHVLHINTLTEILLKQLLKKTQKYDITYKDIPIISMASSLHDIGKISVPSKILNKPGRFTPEEFEIMKQHSMAGAMMLSDLPIFEGEDLVKYAYQICRWHHERYDGKGYPDGLKEDDIPIAAQVVSLADVYDALTSERVYKSAYSHNKAVEMIVNGECGSFNPVLLECLLEVQEQIQVELKTNSSSAIGKKEMEDVVKEIVNSHELMTAERTIKSLEYEKEKYDFFISNSQDILLEFLRFPPLLTLSQAGAKLLGIDECITDPLHNEDFLSIMGSKDIDRLISLLKTAKDDHRDIELYCDVRMNGQMKRSQIICRSFFNEKGECDRVIGKIVTLDKIV